MNLERLFRPRSIAVYGGRWSDYVAEQCRKLGFTGDIWRIHPAREGCFRSLDELPGIPDSVFLGINRELTIGEFDRLRERGIGGAVVFASGFGEVDGGAALAARLDQASAGIPFIGPNCYGFANFFDRVALWPDQAVGQPVSRGVAIIGQSGTISLTLMYQRRSLPVGYVITLGNQQRLGCAEVLRYVADDPRVSAIGMYIEGLGDAGAFADSVDHARRRGKPVALIKTGRSDRSREAVLSHTGAMTGSDVLHDTLFQRLGVARCHSLEELVETLKLFHCHGPMPSNRLLVAGASGGDMAMASDLAHGMDIDFAPLDEERQAELDACTGPGVRLTNPLDFNTHTWFDAHSMQRMFTALFACEHALIANVLDPPDEAEADPSTYDTSIDAMLTAARAAGRPCALVSSLPESLSRYNRERCLAAGVTPMQGLATFLGAFENAAATGRAWRHWRRPRLRATDAAPGPLRTLGEFEGKELLRAHGFDVPEGILCAVDEVASAARRIGAPLVVKAVREGLLHKTDAGGVALGLTSPEQARAAAMAMASPGERVLVERMVTDGVAELIAGIGLDPQFGHFITIGAGGVLAELLKDTATLLPPIDADDVLTALTSLRVFPLLAGWRGRPAGDVDAVVAAVMALAGLAEALDGRLAEIEINPLIVRPAALGAVVADTLVTLKEA